jgi:Ca2+-binding RTX toxin-like protein
LGGAIFVNSRASLTLLNSVFTGNSVTGGTGANNGQADGANIFVNGGTVQSIGTTATIARDYTNVKYTNNGTINAVSFPTNPYEYNRSIYRLTTAGTWQQAQAQAQSLGGNLVTVNNQAEQDWLVSTFGGSEQLWIGLTDEVTEGQFRWASGETSTFTNWLPGEPNNVGNEDYVGMNFDGAGKWNDYSSTSSQRGIIEINQYGATGRNADSQFFVLAKPEPFTISVIGGFGPDIFQLRSYDGLTTSQQVSGGQGSDIFNISLEGSSGTVGLNFNTGKLKQLAELLVTPDWDVREKRRAADINTALIGAGIDYTAAVAGGFANLDPTGIAGGAVDALAANAHLVNDVANIEKNYNLDIEEYQNNLAGIGDFFNGQGANGWGTVNVTQRRSIVEIMDFQPGIDTITLPKLTGNQAYRYTLVSGINGTGVEVAYNNQTNEPSTFLRIYIDPTLLPTVQGQSVGVTQFIESLFTNNATNGVIGTTRNNTSKVAVSGASYTGTIAGDYIYAQNNPTVGSVKIYGLAGDDILAGRNNGTNEIYGGDGDDFIVPGGVNDTIDGGTGYDQVNYSQNGVGISITSSNSTNFKNVESVTGTVYNDTINFSDLQVAPDDGLPINLEGRAGNDSLVGSQYQDVIDGEDGNDTLIGGAGSDILKGGAGIDTLIGGLGNDIYIVDSTTDIITENANEGTDTIQSSVTYTITAANVENLTLTGTTAINGTGNAGNNVITGNAGNNILTGGLGRDRFDYRTLANSALGIFDVITDFNATTGNDLFLVTTARSGFNNVTTPVATLDTAGITARLTNTVFTANSAAQFTFGTRSFVAINNATAGFSATTDAIIEVTGLTGTLGISNFTTTLV